ncbi:protease inhibitor I42 family protein [Nocardia sp. NPDC005978]|uniref:protease inhibitor I42 family protein n=1 Tax=Nocardia sp. NPDC005978 TaxID=3156725 RepID=UPI0033A1DD52
MTLTVLLAAGLAAAGCGDNRNPNEVVASTTGAAVTSAPATTSEAAVTASPVVTTGEAPVPDPLRLGPDANGQVVRLAVGQSLSVWLAANPSTGYAWDVAMLDQNIVKQNGGAEYEQDPSPDGMVGVGGKTLWSFTAVAPGATRLQLQYRRAWEQGVPPAETFTLDLSVA